MKNPPLTTHSSPDASKVNYFNAEAHFKALVEKATDGVVLVGLAGEFKYASPGTIKMFAYDAEEIRNLSPNDLTHPEDLPGVLEILYQIINDPSKTLKHEYRFRHKDGSYKWIESTFSNLLTEPGVESIVINFRDVTERKQAEAQIAQLYLELEQRVVNRTNELQEVNKELETFSYSVSHDLQAPLRRITGFVSLLLDNQTSKLTKEEEQYLGFISASAKEMNDLISAMLSFSRLNRYELHRTNIDMESLVRLVIQSFELETQSRNIDFKIETLPHINGDDELIKQVWTNLISNAIKYTTNKVKATIEIGSISGETEVTYFVKDNGAGFDMKYASKLFGVFQRLHKASEFEGVGIGLANVHRIIMRHGGHCKAEGEVDQGATIYFTLPKT
jgi:PAS domain S-box-containing protein